MSDSQEVIPSDLRLPRPINYRGYRFIAAPSHASFISRFGHAFPKPTILKSELGETALYDLEAPSGQPRRQVLVVHGANTPALGMLAFAKELQALDPDIHVVLYDLWGHGLSSTPLVAHTPQIFHSQILQVLSFMQWSRVHLVGFSFGGATIVTFALLNPWAVSSVAVLAPGGLLHMNDFEPRMQELLKDSGARDPEAIEYIMSWLEGGPLVVPTDWKEKASAGKIVAEALKYWELQEHQGHPRSVLSMFRDGGVVGADESFRDFARLSVPRIAVLADQDDICSEGQLVELGFGHVAVVKGYGHDFVRAVPGEVARIVDRFWQQEVQQRS